MLGRSARTKGRLVSVAKIIELTAESTDSFEDAVRAGLTKAGETLHNIQGAWVDGQEVEIRDGSHYFRVHLKITFVLD
jgi:dodecin